MKLYGKNIVLRGDFYGRLNALKRALNIEGAALYVTPAADIDIFVYGDGVSKEDIAKATEYGCHVVYASAFVKYLQDNGHQIQPAIIDPVAKCPVELNPNAAINPNDDRSSELFSYASKTVYQIKNELGKHSESALVNLIVAIMLEKGDDSITVSDKYRAEAFMGQYTLTTTQLDSGVKFDLKKEGRTAHDKR